MAYEVERITLPFSPLPSRQHGVSLLELLVGVGIVAVLIAIALPGYSRFVQINDQTACSSNLRQIGVAVFNYASDHRGTLPGPMTATQRASYTSHQMRTAPISLLHYIAPYLDLAPPPSRQMAKVFQCPAQAKVRIGEDDPVFYLHRQTVFEDEGNIAQRPFGYQASGSKTAQPMMLANVVRPSETVAIFDTSGTATRPEVHFHTRSVLFIDGHTENVERSRIIHDGSDITIRR